MSSGKKRIAGCMDLGSSYFRLLLAEINPEGERWSVEPFFEDLRYVGWGDEVTGGGHIGGESLQKAMRLLSELVESAEERGCREPVLVGTNTFRKAGNSRQAISSIRGSFSLPLKILSEMGEAALGFEGATSGSGNGQERCVVDLGGTSTEVAWGADYSFEDYVEIPLGTHGVRDICSRGRGWAEFRFMRRNFLRSLEDKHPSILSRMKKLSSLPFEAADSIIATGGTAVSMAVILNFMFRKEIPIDGLRISGEQIGLVKRRIAEALCMGRARNIPVPPQRAGLLMPGILMLETLLDLLGADSTMVTPRDLRWGVLMRGGEIPGRFISHG